jgi:hypothetical protein
MDGKIIILSIFLLICNILPQAVAGPTDSETVAGPKLLTKDQIDSIHNSKILIKFSRELTEPEIKQIDALPNNFNLSKDNVRIIDLDSILNGLKEYIGANQCGYYKNLPNPNSNNKLLSKLKQFFELKQSCKSDPTPNSEKLAESNNLNPKPESSNNINPLMTFVNKLVHNQPAKHMLVAFMAINKFQSLINESRKNLNLPPKDEIKKYINCEASPKDWQKNNNFLDFIGEENNIFFVLQEFFNSKRIHVFLGLPFLISTAAFKYNKYISMYHKFGHFLYAWLYSISQNNDHDDLTAFENFKLSEFLCEIFPMCKSHLFDQKDLNEIITNDYKGNENDFTNTYVKNIIDGLKNFHGKNFNISENLTLFNAAAYNKIWSNHYETAQILGLDKIGDTIFVNRLSDFDYSVAANHPFRMIYYWILKKSTTELNELKPKNFDTLLLTKIKKLREQGIETIIPSENALKALFVLHGKDLEVYKNRIKEIEEKKKRLAEERKTAIKCIPQSIQYNIPSNGRPSNGKNKKSHPRKLRLRQISASPQGSSSASPKPKKPKATNKKQQNQGKKGKSKKAKTGAVKSKPSNKKQKKMKKKQKAK